jgi:UDP-N-acetylglucosamine 2-epimerase (non-hydrolysing)
METENIVEAVTLATSLPWSARYELEEDYSPSSVVVNAIRTKITNFF